jgi:hypothetical protein
LLTVIGLALPRSYILSERLAILELIVPMTVILAAHLSIQRGLRRSVMQFIPFVSFVALVVFFGFLEYFRSWTFYRTQVTTSYPEFVLTRLAGYYTTAINNGQLVLDHLNWPKRLPYETIEAFWTAPGVEWIGLYQKLGGHTPPYARPRSQSIFGDVMSQFGNPELNNQSGYVGGFIDYGRFGGILYFLLIGLIAGLLYRGFRQAKPFGLFLYPVVFLGILELPRYIYWSQGRTTYAWIGLLVIAALVAKSEAKECGEVSSSPHQEAMGRSRAMDE